MRRSILFFLLRIASSVGNYSLFLSTKSSGLLLLNEWAKATICSLLVQSIVMVVAAATEHHHHHHHHSMDTLLLTSATWCVKKKLSIEVGVFTPLALRCIDFQNFMWTFWLFSSIVIHPTMSPGNWKKIHSKFVSFAASGRTQSSNLSYWRLSKIQLSLAPDLSRMVW